MERSGTGTTDLSGRGGIPGWSRRVAGRRQYDVRFQDIGPENAVHGAPTQMESLPDADSHTELCLVALIGPSGSGKSTFASRHFKPTEVVSSDACPGDGGG